MSRRPDNMSSRTRMRARVANLRDRLFDAPSLVQSELTPHEVIHEDDGVRLRWYPPLADQSIVVGDQTMAVRAEAHAVPIVLVAPLAVNMSIYDLFPDRSLVRYLLARGFRVYLIDWGRPSARHDHWRLSTYITGLMPAMLARVRAHAGVEALSLHGWSFGGLFAYGYTAWSGDRHIRNLALIGAPCDYHRNGVLGRQYRRIGRVVRQMGRIRALRPHAIAPRMFRAPGWLNSALYKMTSPVASLRPHFELLTELHDRERVSAHATNAAFLDDMVAYPGGVVQDVLQHLWCDNVMARGRLPIEGSDAALSSIQANLLLVAGKTDPVVTPSATRALLSFVQSRDQQYLEVPGGHMAILSGSRAPADVWPRVADWLALRSGLENASAVPADEKTATA